MNKGIRKIPYIKPIWIAAEKFEFDVFLWLSLHSSRDAFEKLKRVIFIFQIIKSDPRNNEESRPLEWNIGRSLLMIPYCNSHPISISRWCSIEGAWRGSTPLNTRLSSHPSKRDQRYYPTIIRFATHHIRDHANTEREVIAVPFPLASLPTYPNVAGLCEFIHRYENYTKTRKESTIYFHFISSQS